MDRDVVGAVGKLTGRWVRELPAGNSVVSGLGVWPLVALLATAADEPGRGELAAAAGVDADSAAGRAVELVETIERSADLHAAMAIWVHEQLKLSESFDDVVPAALAGTLTGDSLADKAKLDAWAAEHTDGMIRKMPIEVTPDLAVVLASALSLKTTWTKPFKEQLKRLYDGPWAGSSWHWLERTDGDLDSVRRYADSPAGPLTVITVEGDADVDILLGIGDAQRTDVLAGLLAASAKPAEGQLGSALVEQGEPGQEVAPGVKIGLTTTSVPDVKLSLPSFNVEVEHDLLALREIFGLTTVTGPPAGNGHFSGISPDQLVVGSAKQTVLARFFATGFEAAAVTAMGLMRTSMPTNQARRLDVELARPFAFTAVLRGSRLPIVTGWIEQPTEPA
ncbi:serpin (serine protease inhibitor) [Kribbella voronezhensis]|uniref:Serpin (Serine protease inhibitor) n=1 Tax=Kribbella voronezhensis TaxID=2512212 RepID=A0A4R7T8S9_9ACTN|nr:serpin family protein [Kribbella voronezhensis]TDU88311.1 serpin (serine protease inhibitor) [Kribbella voronezhensis]